MNKKIKSTVYKILKEDEYSRKDDGYLIIRVVKELVPELADSSFVNVMFSLKFKKISMESITRARRKFFEEFPYLKVLDVEKARRIEEENYIVEYGNHIPRID